MIGEPVAYTITDAALAAGVSDSVIRRALAKGDLVARYRTSRGVILRSDIEDWLVSAPTERSVSAS